MGLFNRVPTNHRISGISWNLKGSIADIEGQGILYIFLNKEIFVCHFYFPFIFLFFPRTVFITLFHVFCLLLLGCILTAFLYFHLSSIKQFFVLLRGKNSDCRSLK